MKGEATEGPLSKFLVPRRLPFSILSVSSTPVQLSLNILQTLAGGSRLIGLASPATDMRRKKPKEADVTQDRPGTRSMWIISEPFCRVDRWGTCFPVNSTKPNEVEVRWGERSNHTEELVCSISTHARRPEHTVHFLQNEPNKRVGYFCYKTTFDCEAEVSKPEDQKSQRPQGIWQIYVFSFIEDIFELN